MLAGVEAPAVMPIFILPFTGRAASSAAVSMRYVCAYGSQTSLSFAVFEL